jgi:hypothetical protein
MDGSDHNVHFDILLPIRSVVGILTTALEILGSRNLTKKCVLNTSLQYGLIARNNDMLHHWLGYSALPQTLNE